MAKLRGAWRHDSMPLKEGSSHDLVDLTVPRDMACHR